MFNNNEIILHLSLIDNVGPATIDDLVKRKPWDLDLQDLYQMSVSDLIRLFSLPLIKAEAIVQGLQDRSLVDRELELINVHAINWMTLYNSEYPQLLKNIHCPPSIIYWQGAMPTNGMQSLAVIGSRKINYYGISVIESFIPELVAQGWTIVSGGAIGADAAAHRVTVDAGGHTIAILGSGLLNPYPGSHKRLFAEILDTGGTLLSSFPVSLAAFPGNFPARNRIIAGLSRGCLVVSAASKSGTRITAQYALEQGRELFAVPGPIDDELTAGCHALIQEGAKLVTSVADILIEFGLEQVQQGLPENNEKQMDLLKAQAHEKSHGAFKADGPEATILRSCTKPCSIDDLAEKTGLLMSDLYVHLFELELSGAIRQQVNGMWQRV